MRLTGIELSPEIVSIARERQGALGRTADLRFGDAHEPLDYLKGAAFQVERLKRSKWGIFERVAARKPADGG